MEISDTITIYQDKTTTHSTHASRDGRGRRNHTALPMCMVFAGHVAERPYKLMEAKLRVGEYKAAWEIRLYGNAGKQARDPALVLEWARAGYSEGEWQLDGESFYDGPLDYDHPWEVLDHLIGRFFAGLEPTRVTAQNPNVHPTDDTVRAMRDWRSRNGNKRARQ